MERRVILVTGIPGAGKTTVSRLLAQRLERGVHIESDALQLMIQNGRVWPDGSPKEEADRQLRLRVTNCCLLAGSFFEAGFTPIIDDVILGKRLDEFLHDLQGRPVYLVTLLPRLEVVQQRDAGRDKHVFETWGHLHEELSQQTPRLGVWIDSSDQTADETVDEIVRRLGTEAPPLSASG